MAQTRSHTPPRRPLHDVDVVDGKQVSVRRFANRGFKAVVRPTPRVPKIDHHPPDPWLTTDRSCIRRLPSLGTRGTSSTPASRIHGSGSSPRQEMRSLDASTAGLPSQTSLTASSMRPRKRSGTVPSFSTELRLEDNAADARVLPWVMANAPPRDIPEVPAVSETPARNSQGGVRTALWHRAIRSPLEQTSDSSSGCRQFESARWH